MKALDYHFILGESEWDLDFYAITVDESIEVCKLTGIRWVQLVHDFDQRDAIAVKAFFWLARKKSGEQIRFDSPLMNFKWSDFRCTAKAFSDDEEPSTSDSKATADPTPATSEGETSQPK